MEIKELIKKLNGDDKSSDLVRSLYFTIDRETIDEDKQIIPMSVSSDVPYERRYGFEILDHNEKSIRLDRFKNGAAFRDTHWGDQVGVILNPVIDTKKKKLRIDVQFSKNDERAVTLFKDIKDGIRKNVSIRYIIHEMILEKEEDDVATYRVTDWEPIHASLEPDPADHSVGPGRSAELLKENNLLKNKISQLTINPQGRNIMETEITQAQLDKAVSDAQKAGGEAGAKRAQGIYATVAMFKDQVTADYDIMAEASKAVASNGTSEAFNEEVYKSIKKQLAIKANDAKIGMTAKQAKTFSITRAVNAIISGNWDKAEDEREASIEARKKQPEQRGSFTIPFDVISAGHFGRRELSVGTPSAGGYLVGTENLATSFIDILRNKSVLARANATVLDGLVGNVNIPKKLTGGGAVWVAAEGGDATDTDMTFGQIPLTPATIASRTELTRNALMQTNPAIDRLAENDLIEAVGLAIDLAGIHGTGANGQPKGVANITGIGSVTGSAFSFAKAVEFKKKVKIANAFNGNLSWITNPTTEALLETLEKAEGTAKYLLENEKMAGYPEFSSNQISANHLFFGDWSQLIIALWGGLDVIVDAISSNDGNVKIKVFQSADIALRHPGSICKSSNVAVA